jgi:hypothetical protein
MNRFARSARSWQEILEFIQQSPLGEQLVPPFVSLCKAGKIAVRAYPSDLRAELLSVQESGCPVGAVFVTDGVHGQILYDGQGELGILIPFVFHEIVHSLDERLWLAAGKRLSAEARNQLVYSSESLAFNAQHELQEGLKKIYPELRVFHQDRYPHISFLNRAISSQEICSLYRLVLK